MEDLVAYHNEAASVERHAIALLRDYLTQRFIWVTETISMYPEGMLTWHLLWFHFKPGDELQTAHDVSGEPVSSEQRVHFPTSHLCIADGNHSRFLEIRPRSYGPVSLLGLLA